MSILLNRINHKSLSFLGCDADKLSKTVTNPWRYVDDKKLSEGMKAWYNEYQDTFADTIAYVGTQAGKELKQFTGHDAASLLYRFYHAQSPDKNVVTSGTTLFVEDSIMMYTIWVWSDEERQKRGNIGVSLRGVAVNVKKKNASAISLWVDYECDAEHTSGIYADVSDFENNRSKMTDTYTKCKNRITDMMIEASNMAVCLFLAYSVGQLDEVRVPSNTNTLDDGTPPPVDNRTGYPIIYVNSIAKGLPTASFFKQQIDKQIKNNKTMEPKETPTPVSDAFASDYNDYDLSQQNLEYNSSSVEVDGITIPTVKTDITDCNILEVEVGTTGHKGGDSGHGGRTYFRIEDLASTDIRIRPLNDDMDSGVEIILGGDAELDTFTQALKYAYDVLTDNAPNPIRSGKSIKYFTYWGSPDFEPNEQNYNRRLYQVKDVFFPYSPDHKNYQVLYNEFFNPDGVIAKPKFIGAASIPYNDHGTLTRANVYCVILANAFTYFLSNNLQVLQQFR